MKQFKNYSFFLFAVLTLLISCSKGGDNNPAPPPPPDNSIHPTALNIDLAKTILLPGTTKQFTVTFTPANTTNKNLVWTSSNNAIATVDANGLVTAVAKGTVTITATSADRATVFITATVDVLQNYNIHVVGNGAFGVYTNCAIYWKNGVAAGLPGGHTTGSNAYAVTGAGNDIYISGATLNSNSWGIITYWKNGVPVQLSDPAAQHNSFAKSIAVSGNKVVIAGYAFYNTECPDYCFGRFRGSYWVDNNGAVTHHPLYNAISSTEAFGVAFSGSDILVAGSRANNNFGRWGILWKNDFTNETVLTNTTQFYRSMAIAVGGTDVYAAGYGSCPDIGCITTAFLWKNNSANPVALTNGSTDAVATGIAIANGIVYVCGSEKNSQGIYVARYWKIENNNVTSYALSNGNNHAMANSIAVSGEDIFVAGFDTDNTGKKTATYWRSFKDMTLTTSLPTSLLFGSNHAEANGIYVN